MLGLDVEVSKELEGLDPGVAGRGIFVGAVTCELPFIPFESNIYFPHGSSTNRNQ